MIEIFEWKATSRLWQANFFGAAWVRVQLAEVPAFSMPQLLRSVVFSHEMIVWSCMIPFESNISNINQSRAFHVILAYPGIPVPSNRLFLAKSWEILLAAATFHHSASGSSSPVSWCFLSHGWLVSVLHCNNQPLPSLWDGCRSPYLRLVSVVLNEVGSVFSRFGFAKCILFKKRRQTWQTTCKINSWELRPDLYLVHRKGFAVTVKSSRAAALQGFLVTQPSHKATAQKDQNTDSAEKT